MYDEILNGDISTNNALESFNEVWNNQLGTKSNVWNGLLRRKLLHNKNLLATVAGQDQFTNSGRDERRREKHNTLTNIVSNYHLVPQDDYLKSLASELAKSDK